MSIFNNINNILVQEDTNSNDINIENIHTDTDIEKYSFMTETYDFILGYTKEYNNKSFVLPIFVVGVIVLIFIFISDSLMI